MTIDNGPPQGATDHTVVIHARSLSRIFAVGAAEVSAVDRIDLTIANGSLVVLKGDSGSGKSTLLSLLGGLDRMTGGTLTVAGVDLNQCNESDLTHFRRKTVGMVFQTFNLLPTLSVLENVCLPGLLAGRSYPELSARAKELLAWLDLGHRMTHRPRQLSGGEMQRTAIARALINDPAIVLADEPTGNLDSRNARKVMALLADLNQSMKRTVVIATHSNLADPYATELLEMRDGRVVP